MISVDKCNCGIALNIQPESFVNDMLFFYCIALQIVVCPISYHFSLKTIVETTFGWHIGQFS